MMPYWTLSGSNHIWVQKKKVVEGLDFTGEGHFIRRVACFVNQKFRPGTQRQRVQTFIFRPSTLLLETKKKSVE